MESRYTDVEPDLPAGKTRTLASRRDMISAQKACCSLTLVVLNQRVREKPRTTLCLNSTSAMSAARQLLSKTLGLTGTQLEDQQACFGTD